MSKGFVTVRLDGVEDLLKGALSGKNAARAKNLAKREFGRFAAGVRQEIRQAAPVVTGNLKKAIKSRTTSSGGAQVYVDRSGSSSGRGYHWHLVERGSKLRKTKRGANRGRMTAETFVEAAVQRARRRFQDEVAKRVLRDITGVIKGDL